MGNSNPYDLTKSKQIATNKLAQKFSANCGILCEKVIDGKRFEFKKGGTGGFSIAEKCSVNGDCLMESSVGALATILFAVPNSSNAKEVKRSLPSGFPGEKNWPNTAWSRQEINTSGSQTLLGDCNVKNTNIISNVEWLTTAQKFEGPVAIVNAESLESSCMLSKTLTASALALATEDNTATSGKNKKKAKGRSLWIVLSILLGGVLLSGRGVWAYINNKKQRQPE